MKEIADKIYSMKLRQMNYQTAGKTFNLTSEKFKPKIVDPSKMKSITHKQYILRAVPKSLAPCKIPIDYIERRKYLLSIIQNQKLQKGFASIPKRDKPGLNLKDVTDAILKITDKNVINNSNII